MFCSGLRDPENLPCCAPECSRNLPEPLPWFSLPAHAHWRNARSSLRPELTSAPGPCTPNSRQNHALCTVRVRQILAGSPNPADELRVIVDQCGVHSLPQY